MLNQVQESELKEFSRSIELIASRFLEGNHRSLKGGAGQEYLEHFSYAEGEDAKQIDWKRWAASDRLLVRRFQEQKKTSWCLLLDKSPSLAFAQKGVFAKTLSASFIFIANVLGDQWRLDGSSRVGLLEVFPELLAEPFIGPHLIERKIGSATDQRLIVISDFFEDEEILGKKIRQWQAEFKSIALIQILDTAEINFPYDAVTEFKDLESESKMVIDPKILRDNYLKLLKSHQRKLESFLQDGSFFMTVEAKPENIFLTLERLFEKL